MQKFAQIHKHRRSRGCEKTIPYPAKEKQYRNLDRLVDIISFLFPLTMIPQILEIWVNKKTDGVSFLSWSLFLLFSLPLLYYTHVHHEKRLQIMYALFTLAYIFVVLGLILYR